MKDNFVDTYIISFGLRNTTHIDNALSEAFKIKGGGFYCLEFYKVNKPILSNIYNFYSKTIPFWSNIHQNTSLMNILLKV